MGLGTRLLLHNFRTELSTITTKYTTLRAAGHKVVLQSQNNWRSNAIPLLAHLSVPTSLMERTIHVGWAWSRDHGC